MTICEVTLKLYKTTKFSSHNTYCRHMGIILNDEKIGHMSKVHFSSISDVLRDIFAMDAEISGKYIADYFLLEKYLVFENIVRATKEFFPAITDLC